MGVSLKCLLLVLISTAALTTRANSISSDSCAQDLICLAPSTIMPMFSHVGADVTADLFAAGITSANVAPVPIPGAISFLFSGVSLLASLRRSNI